jgi:hypothetical protein
MKQEKLMKKTIAFTALILAALVFIPFASAQTSTGNRGQSINGSTGLFSIPSGHIGWEGPGNFALDLGYRAVINNDAGAAHIPAFTVSLFKWVELSMAFDIQPEYQYYYNNRENDDLLLGFKVRLPTTGKTSIAIGGKLQIINFENDHYDYNAFQPYIGITYPGTFFVMPAETTIVFGKTFYSEKNNSDIDFGIGFDLLLFPDVFKNTVHWIIDFSNFAYSDHAWPNYSLQPSTGTLWRGVLNTGFRIDLSTIPALSKFKFLIDLIFNDLFDDGSRSFTVGVVFGFSP